MKGIHTSPFGGQIQRRDIKNKNGGLFPPAIAYSGGLAAKLKNTPEIE